MTHRFQFAGQPEPELTFGPAREWGALSARRVHSTPGRYRGGGRDEHQLVIYLSEGVASDCACEDQRVRRIGEAYEFDFVPAGATGFWEDEEPMDMIGVRFSPSLVAETADALGLPAELTPRLGARDRLIEHIGRALEAELDAPGPAGRLYADSLAVALTTRLLQNFASAAPGRQLLSKPQIRRLVEYVEENLDAELGLAELAGVVGLSVPHLTALFRRTLGQSVHSYVMERRVCRARTLLLAGQASISQAALDAGFAHPSHLARWMRRLLGVTPSQIAPARI